MAFDPDAYLAKEDKKKSFDPDAYLAKTKPETALQTFGRSAASIPDTALNLITGALDYGAYNLARAAGLSPEEAQRQTTSPKDVIGRAFGVAGSPGYENAPQRQLGNYIGQNLGEGVLQPLAQFAGLPEQDVGSMVNSLTMAAGPVVPKVLKPVYNTAKSAVQAAPEFTSGVVNTLSRQGTKPGERATYAGQYESARQPAGTTYNTPENLQAWREGLIDTAELNKRAVPYTAEQATALKRTGGMVPYSGQVARATGEALADPYTRLSGYIPDLATAAVGYGLLGPAGAVVGPALNLARKGVGLYNAGKTTGSMRQLGDLGFEPLYAQELAALRQGKPNPSVISPATGPIRPAQTSMAVQTPAAQAALATTQAKTQTTPPLQIGYTAPKQPTMYVAPEGVAGTNLPQVEKAALQQRYAPQPVAQPVAQSGSLFETPLSTPEVTAAPKPLTTTASVGKTAEQLASEQALLNLINQKRGIQETPAPVVETPKRKNVRQEERVRQLEEERTSGMSAEQKAADEQAILDRIAKKANPSSQFNKTLKGSGGKGAMGLMTEPLEMLSKKSSAAEKIKAAEWLTPEQFDQEVFMSTLGKGADKEFIAKGEFPEGKLIRAVDKKMDSELVQYNNGDGFMIRKNPKSTASQYSILNKDGTRYEIGKTGDSITSVEVLKGDKIVAEYNASPNKQGAWWVAEEMPDGGSMMVYKNDLGISKNPNTRKLHQQLPKINFNDIVNEQLARLQSLKEVK